MIQSVEMDDLGEKVYAEKRNEFHKVFLQRAEASMAAKSFRKEGTFPICP